MEEYNDREWHGEIEGGVVLSRAFVRRVLALLSGYRRHLNEHRQHCPEGRNLPNAIEALRDELASDTEAP